MNNETEKIEYIAPNACAYCKWEERSHGLYYHHKGREENGYFEGYVAPSNELRLERMKYNRKHNLTYTTR